MFSHLKKFAREAWDVVSNKKLLTGAIADRLLIKETVRRVLPLLPVIDDHRARQLACKKITLNGRRRRYYETKKRNRRYVYDSHIILRRIDQYKN